MKLETIRPCFTYMTEKEQEVFFLKYYERRNKELEEAILLANQKKERKCKVKEPKDDRMISVTP